MLTTGISDLQSPGVIGTMTARQALQQMLSGTGVSSAFTSARTVALDLRPLSEFVSVEGAPARTAAPKATAPLRDTPVTELTDPGSS